MSYTQIHLFVVQVARKELFVVLTETLAPQAASCPSGLRCSYPEITCPEGAATCCPPDGSACPGNGVCSNGLICGDTSTPGGVCSDGSACPDSGTCPDGSSCVANPSVCSDGSACPASGICPTDGSSCRPNPGNPDCPDGSACPASGICPTDGSSCRPNPGNPDCPDGSSCPTNGICSDGSICGNPNGEVSCEDNQNQVKCRIGNGNPGGNEPDPCIAILGRTCKEEIREGCLPPQCRITSPDGNPVFYDPNGNPITHNNLVDIGTQLGLTREEIQNMEDEIQNIQQNARNQMGGGGGSQGGLKSHGALSSSNGNEALSATSSEEFKPSLSNGGGSSSNSGNTKGRAGANSPNFSRQLQSLLDQQKNHQSSVKKHGYKPTKLGNQPIGTSHDNIFDMISRGYQAREDSLNAR